MSVIAALTVAGSDSGGGAGIQADLRTFAALEVYGTSAITAVTAQSTLGVFAVERLSLGLLRAQLDAVLGDFDVRAAKTGMLADAQTVELVAEVFWQRPELPLVVDPVMIAESGARLTDDAGMAAITARLIPRAAVVTPNLPELAALLGRPEPEAVEDMVAAGQALIERGARTVLVKGGHRRGDPIDVLVGAGAPLVLPGARIATRSTHGTGCTYSAAIAARLALGQPLREAVRFAHDYVRAAIEAASRAAPVGHGKGPLHHLHAYYAWPPAPPVPRDGEPNRG